MIFVEQDLKVEYETEKERETHIDIMIGKGYRFRGRFGEIDIAGREHLYAKFTKREKGYSGKSIFDTKKQDELIK
jgi:hypothetical protein